MKSAALLSAALFVSLASPARAGQKFSFDDPVANGSYANGIFETTNLYPGNSFPAASFRNLYTGTVTLTVDNFSPTGAYLGSSSVPALYTVGKSSVNGNDLFSGTLTSGAYATGAGHVTFVDPANPSQVYFEVDFTKSALTTDGFAAAETLTFSGSLFNTSETGNPNASFGFLDRYASGGTAHYTGDFTASIGTIGKVQATPEPAPLLGLALGALPLIRRRRASTRLSPKRRIEAR